ncbi:3-deoxy-7-phosphoheptulonate synthase [Spirochaeta thermophila]|uniref:Phospho-2-dehydro-3-deoxyheptonate aldolase n=1 Tax=Winmispira thermophila (strain ATCC 49972 / DSM 6192 / RI 19.B1) TaxID=665571 RepID=E0RRE2_WINT6|nr:3-deoxy-7-phosphoheptulonate synthase [Spirochaeta thermophila]ADN01643.1 phospho-2-dehydro-3-deoxyheptonate aldolase, Tyr-sensitive [Spirochaeta thermophila DSM 6192]
MVTRISQQAENLHIHAFEPLISPRELKEALPLTEKALTTVVEARKTIVNILTTQDPRPIGLVGPCSIHDPVAALDYARRLAALREKVKDRLFLVMRVYFEKPRTSVGWRGFIFDPHLDGSGDIAYGLREARRLLLEINEMGLPAGSELLDSIVPQYIADLISWASIGARTTESQTHRDMASGLSMPVGFKNSTDGSIDNAINALKASRHPHSFLGIDQEGRTCIVRTTGNPHGHIILRGGRQGPNYYEEFVEEAEARMREEGFGPAIMIDCSHANSGKRFVRQERVFRAFLDQRLSGRTSLIGFMLESNIHEGCQKIPEDLSQLKYGVSITDECIGWEKTEELILEAYHRLGG